MKPARAVGLWRSGGNAVAAVLLGLAMVMGCLPAWSQDGNLQSTTQQTIRQLIHANSLLLAGQASDARAMVQSMVPAIRLLEERAQKFRQMANREHDRCSERIGQFDVETNRLFIQQNELNQRIASLTASLQGAAVAKDLAASEIARLKTLLADTARGMREREAKLQELQNWWWVPFYGQYLAVRTLVDDDISQYNSAIGSLYDQQARLGSNSNTYAHAQATIGMLSAQKAKAEKVHAELVAMRISAQATLRDLNAIAVFLTDADLFWGIAENLLQVDAAAFVQKMKVIQDVLGRSVTSPSFKDPSKTLSEHFQVKLVDFADSIDKQSNFLLNDTTDFCGGPAQVLDAQVVERCNIGSIAKFYRITDAKTCAFEFTNPPNCPPAPKLVEVTDAAIAAGKARGTWTSTTDQDWQNWVGAGRCGSAAAIYYGKLQSPEACESKCMADSECTIWTYNRLYSGAGNQLWVNSKEECWGGTAALPVVKSPPVWGGLVSGGIR